VQAHFFTQVVANGFSGYGNRAGRQEAFETRVMPQADRPPVDERRNSVDMKTKVSSGIADEFAKFAHDTVEILRGRAGELEETMTKVLKESSKEWGLEMGDAANLSSYFGGTKLGTYLEKKPRRAAAIGLMGGMMLSRVMESRRAREVVDVTPTASPTPKTGKPTKRRTASKRKLTKVAAAA
jgi:hypothetical protein